VTIKFQVQNTKKGNNRVQITELFYVELNKTVQECIGYMEKLIYRYIKSIYIMNDCIRKLKQVNDFQILTKSVEHFMDYMEKSTHSVLKTSICYGNHYCPIFGESLPYQI
jgi:hypothetical protein